MAKRRGHWTDSVRGRGGGRVMSAHQQEMAAQREIITNHANIIAAVRRYSEEFQHVKLTKVTDEQIISILAAAKQYDLCTMVHDTLLNCKVLRDGKWVRIVEEQVQ